MWLVAAAVASGVLLAQIEAQPARDDAEQEVVEHVPVLTRAPELVEFVDAEFPEDAQADGVAGEVLLLITISETGEVTDAVVQGPLDPRLDEAAVAAARQLRFTPAEVDDVPSPVQIEFRYVFTLAPPPPPPEEDAAEAAPLPVTVRGRVLVRGRRDPLDGALVISGESTATTDADGAFELRLPVGEHPVSVKSPGFFPFDTSESVDEGRLTEVTYYLLRRSGSPYETVVRAPRPKKEVSQVTLERKELQSVPGTFGDPLRVIENLPGMARAPFVGGQLLVRGANPEDSGVYFDGIGIPLLYHFGGLTSVVNAEFLEEINFQPGGFGARYGRATAGIVDVESRRLTGKLARGSAEVDLMDASFFYRRPLGDKAAFAIAARRSYVDAILPIVLKIGGAQNVTLAPQYTDYQLKVDWDVAPKHELTFFAFGSDDTFKVITPGADRERAVEFRLRIGFHRFVVTHDWELAPDLRLRSRPFVGVTIQDAGGGEVGEGGYQGSLRLIRWEAGLRQDLTWEASEQLTLRAGIDLYGLRANADLDVPFGGDILSFPSPRLSLTENQQFEVDSGGSGNAVWLEASWNPVKPLRITPGLRYELYVFAEEVHHIADPRLAVRYELLEGSTVKAGVGLYRQPPDIFVISDVTGNPLIRPEAARHYIVGYEQRLTDDLDLDIELFVNNRYSLAVSSGEVVVRDGEEVTENYNNDGKGRAFGLELLLRHKLTERFFGWIAYTLMKAEERDHPGDPFIRTEFDQTHILTVVGSYRLGRGFEVGGRFRLVTGNPYTPVIGSSHDLDTDGWRSQRGATRSARLPLFHQLDIRAEYTHTYRIFTISYFLDLLNVYNHHNVEDFQYDYRYRERVDFVGLPIFPVLGVKGEF